MHKFSHILFLTMIALGGCVDDLPHGNPLDPLSTGYSAAGSLSGLVEFKNSTTVPAADVRIDLFPQKEVTFTDSLGRFSFSAVLEGNLAVVVSGDNISPETTRVSFASKELRTVRIPVNALPAVHDPIVLTKKIDQWWPGAVYSADVTAVIDDVNGFNDIDSVWCMIDTIRFPMSYSLYNKNFYCTIQSTQIPSNNLEWLIGKEVTIIARDRYPSFGFSDKCAVSRIIDQAPVPAFPIYTDTVSTAPEFSWNRTSATFDYYYKIELFRVDAGTQTLFWTSDPLGSYLRSFQYPKTVLVGNYFWTIAVIDKFGNFARSKESSFTVR